MEDKPITWISGCGQLELKLTRRHLDLICKPGNNDIRVAQAVQDPTLLAQFEGMDLDDVRRHLTEYGIEDAKDMDRGRLLNWLVWMAAWDVHDNPECYLDEGDDHGKA